MIMGAALLPEGAFAQAIDAPAGCYGWNAYSITTGQKCFSISTTLPYGCTSTTGYSPLTGVKCDSGSTAPSDCSAGDLFSRSTGQRCNNTADTSVDKQLTDKDTGSILTFSAGQTFSVILRNPGDGGYTFDQPVYDSSVLSLLSHTHTSSTINTDGTVSSLRVGDFGTDTWQFQAKSAGSATLKIDATRSWDASSTYTAFSANITVVSSVPVPSSGPVISGVSGPTSLSIGQTGTWSVSASDSLNRNLSYSVNWGDVYYATCGNGTGCTTSQSVQQTATFTHSYAKAGTYTITFTVSAPNTIRCFTTPCPSNEGSDSTSMKINVGNASTNSVTVVSPNGGETWTKGTMQYIRWTDNGASACPAGASCAQPARPFDIKLVPYSAPCTYACPLVAVHDPYTITSGVVDFGSSRSYPWTVGRVQPANGSAPETVPDGSYTVQICISGTSDCDSSNSFFKIISSNSSGPVISGVSGPQTLNTGQTGMWKVSAQDPSNVNLSYSVRWGDEGKACSSILGCATSIGIQQSATFTHNYAQAGTYTPTFTVYNSSGQSAETSLSVVVSAKAIAPATFQITSPGNSDTWFAGSTHNITWMQWDGNTPVPVSLSVYPYSGTCNLEVCSIPVTKIASNLPGAFSGSYSWTIPTSLIGGAYYMRLDASDGGSASTLFKIDRLAPTY